MRRRMRPDGAPIRPERIKRVVVYGVLLLLLAAAQCSFFGQLRFLPATPDLILCTLVAVLLRESGRTAAVFGIAGGLLLDATGSVGASLRPLFYLLVAVAVGLLAEKMLPSILSWLLLMIPALLLRAAFTLLTVILFVGREPILSVLRQVILPELIVTAVLGLPLYGILSLCALLAKDRRDRTPR